MGLIRLMKKKVRLANWHLSMLKICCACFGILIGMYFGEFFEDYVLALFIVGTVTSVWITVVWLKAMCKDSCNEKSDKSNPES